SGDQSSCGVWPDAVDGREQRADLVLFELGLDVPIELAKAPSKDVEVLAVALDLHAVCLPMMTTDGDLRRLDELVGELETDKVHSVILEVGQGAGPDAHESFRSGVVLENGGGQLTVERLDVASELGKAEIDQAVKLANPVVEVLLEPVAET